MPGSRCGLVRRVLTVVVVVGFAAQTLAAGSTTVTGPHGEGGKISRVNGEDYISYTYIESPGSAGTPAMFKVFRPRSDPPSGLPKPRLLANDVGSWVFIGEGNLAPISAMMDLDVNGIVTWTFMSIDNLQKYRASVPAAEPATSTANMAAVSNTPPNVSSDAQKSAAAGSAAYSHPALADYPPEVASAMREEAAVYQEAKQTVQDKDWTRRGMDEDYFTIARRSHCIPDNEPGAKPPDSEVLARDAKARDCWLRWTHARTQSVRRLLAADKAGAVPRETLLAVTRPESLFAEPAPVNPLNGSGARIEHAGSTATLTYTDAGGTLHKYAVARPTFAQGIVQGDAGGWMYIASDRKSGIMFNLGAGGQVTGKPANPMMLQMMSGQ